MIYGLSISSSRRIESKSIVLHKSSLPKMDWELIYGQWGIFTQKLRFYNYDYRWIFRNYRWFYFLSIWSLCTGAYTCFEYFSNALKICYLDSMSTFYNSKSGEKPGRKSGRKWVRWPRIHTCTNRNYNTVAVIGSCN